MKHGASASAGAAALRSLDRPFKHSRRLYYGAHGSVERALVVRSLTVLVLVGLILAIFWLDRAGLRDVVDGDVSAVDILYFTMVTVTTVGYGDIVPVTDSTRLLDALLVTPVRFFIWLIFFGTAYQFVVERILEDFRMRMQQARLQNHVVICGFGLSGRSAAAEFVKRGVAPHDIVVVDGREDVLEEAAEAGYFGLRGDVSRESTLREACVDRARVVLICVGRDDTTVLTALTIRQLWPAVRIVANVREQENEKLVIQGGANTIVSPSVLAGALLAKSVESSQVVDYVRELVSEGGRVTLRRRDARAEDIGKRPGDFATELLLRIHRGKETIGFWEKQAIVRAGDVLLMVTPEDSNSGV